MKKINNAWANGLVKAWGMLYFIPLDRLFVKFIDTSRKKCRGMHILLGMVGAAFIAGFLLVLLSSLLMVINRAAGVIIGSIGIVTVMLWSDHCGGMSVFSEVAGARLQGRKFSEIFATLRKYSESVNANISSALFAALGIFKLAVFAVILLSGNYFLFILIFMSSAFTAAFTLSSCNSANTFWGFASRRERYKFYMFSFLLLLLGAKLNLMVSLAFAGGIMLLNYWINEHFIKLPNGKSDVAVTLYGEAASLIAILISLIYSAGSLAV